MRHKNKLFWMIRLNAVSYVLVSIWYVQVCESQVLMELSHYNPWPPFILTCLDRILNLFLKWCLVHRINNRLIDCVDIKLWGSITNGHCLHLHRKWGNYWNDNHWEFHFLQFFSKVSALFLVFNNLNQKLLKTNEAYHMSCKWYKLYGMTRDNSMILTSAGLKCQKNWILPSYNWNYMN